MPAWPIVSRAAPQALFETPSAMASKIAAKKMKFNGKKPTIPECRSPRRRRIPMSTRKETIGPISETSETDDDDPTIPSALLVRRDGFQFANRIIIESIAMDFTQSNAFRLRRIHRHGFHAVECVPAT
uniref:BTB domain-containing protein n=1 Tax=Panagrellus redivivus TaxID=6233 RepID=A0A7E4W221_PANRE